jgi:Spy/CpxP family protein refolding chaperone
MTTRRSRTIAARGLCIALLVLAAAGAPRAQRGGGNLPRLDILIDTFSLTRDQERAVEALMDEAGRTAAPIREALPKARAAIVAAIRAGSPQADVDAAVRAYAVQATAMAELEMRTLARLMETLTPEQRANAAAVQAAFFLLRNAFINRNWDEVPNPDRGY